MRSPVMPAKNHLSYQQKEILLKTLKESENPYIRERVLILLLMNDGKTYEEIGEFLGLSYPTVAYWAVHADPDNLDSFNDGREKGNFRKATEEYIELLLRLIEKEPEEYGYKFGRWTAARLASHLEKETGIKLSGSQIRRILERKKYVYLWAKYSLENKQDPEKRKLFKEKLEEYLKIAKTTPNGLQVWFWDESGFSLRVIRRKVWVKKGMRKKVTGQRAKGRVNIMGCLRYTDKKRVNFFVEKGNANTFYEQLKAFYEIIKKEWIERGNCSENFEKLCPKIVIILDNASFHKRKDILKLIETEMPNIILEFLPPYSPDFNLIELVWHSAKEYIANKLFESVEELENLLNKLLNEGELIIKWGRKIKNKGNAVY
jgi:transposase